MQDIKATEPLGAMAERLSVPDATALVTGSGRCLKGRVVVTDPVRAAELFPPPSEETLRRIRDLESAARWVSFRLMG